MSSCLVTGWLGENTYSHFTTPSFQVYVESGNVPHDPPFLQAKHPQLPQMLLIWHSLDPSPEPLPFPGQHQHLNAFLQAMGPEMDRVLKMQPHHCQVQRKTFAWSCWPHYSWYIFQPAPNLPPWQPRAESYCSCTACGKVTNTHKMTFVHYKLPIIGRSRTTSITLPMHKGTPSLKITTELGFLPGVRCQ